MQNAVLEQKTVSGYLVLAFMWSILFVWVGLAFYYLVGFLFGFLQIQTYG